MAIILDGKMLRDKIFESLKAKLDKMQQKPTLAVILVGENPASQIYVRNKKKTAEKLGINSLSIEYPSDISEEELLNKIKELNSYREEHKLDYEIEADGGIKVENSEKIIDAGADILVAGTAIINSKDYAETIKKLK